jgi:hypothetical protein
MTRTSRTRTPTDRTTAATARPLSKPVIPDTMGRGAAAGRDAIGAAAAGARGAAAAAAGAVGALAAGAGVGPAAGADGARTAPAAGGAGILMVDEAEGLGGRLMRTVSFLGCTLAASGALDGTPPSAGSVCDSAIRLLQQPRCRSDGCQSGIPANLQAG